MFNKLMGSFLQWVSLHPKAFLCENRFVISVDTAMAFKIFFSSLSLILYLFLDTVEQISGCNAVVILWVTEE